jgi:hypothetical protein
MRLIITFLQIVLCSIANAGEWTIVNDTTLSFSGAISLGEFERFRRAYKRGIKELIVDSPGGSTFEAIEIGTVIYRDKLDIKVEGKCLSSCALYFFLPAKKKTLKNGLVGFHGSVGVTQELYPEDFYNPSNENLALLGLSKKEAVEKLLIHVEREKALFKLLGISKELFLISDSFKGPKLMGCEAATKTLIPSIDALQKYGVTQIEGPIDPKLIETIKKQYSAHFCFI